MNHNVYHIEKQTFHFGGYWLLTEPCFPYLDLPVSRCRTPIILFQKLIPDPPRFLPVWFIFGIFGLCCYLYLGFLIAEADQISSRVTSRYLTLPLRRQVIIRSKHGSFLERFSAASDTECQCFIFPFLDTGCLFTLWKLTSGTDSHLLLFCFFSDSDFAEISVPRSLRAETSSLKHGWACLCVHPYPSFRFLTSYLVYTK